MLAPEEAVRGQLEGAKRPFPGALKLRLLIAASAWHSKYAYAVVS